MSFFFFFFIWLCAVQKGLVSFGIRCRCPPTLRSLTQTTKTKIASQAQAEPRPRSLKLQVSAQGREHTKRRVKRNKEKRLRGLQRLQESFPQIPYLCDVRDLQQSNTKRYSDIIITWDDVPKCIDPSYDYKHGVVLGDPAYDYKHGVRLGDGAKKAIKLDGSQQEDHDPVSQDQDFTDRARRKRYQVESFYVVLERLVQSVPPDVRLRIVDFGSGTGNLCLPLAFLFPQFDFIGLDMKRQSVDLLSQRAAAAGLTNVYASFSDIQIFDQPFDIGLALHACGAATDLALAQVERNRAAYVCVPCCVGKLSVRAKPASFKFRNTNTAGAGAGAGTGSVRAAPSEFIQGGSDSDSDSEGSVSPGGPGGPRSAWLTQALGESLKDATRGSDRDSDRDSDSENENDNDSDNDNDNDSVSRSTSFLNLFSDITKVGDISHGWSVAPLNYDPSHEALARWCKSCIEHDRNQGMAARGYATAMLRILQAEEAAKSDLLIGVPRENKAGLDAGFMGL